MKIVKMKDKGFTLIELLVVIAIIGILAAIAIPQFSEYRQRGFDSRALSDLRNGATSEEAYFVDNEVYLTCADGTACEADLPAFQVSDAQVTVSFTANNGNSPSFTGASNHPKGSGANYSWASDSGGLQ